MRNNWIRIPLTILLLWLGLTGFKQGITGFLDDSDWSDDYLRSQAVIVDSERKLSSDVSTGMPLQSCRLIVEYQFEGETHRARPVWLYLPRARHFPEEDCGEARYGEEVEVWIGKSGNEPMLMQPGNRSAKPVTLAFNLAQGVLFLWLVVLLWRPGKRTA